MIRPASGSTLFPSTTLFRSADRPLTVALVPVGYADGYPRILSGQSDVLIGRSEEHTSNSSHPSISYAVFCLKKKKTEKTTSSANHVGKQPHVVARTITLWPA